MRVHVTRHNGGDTVMLLPHEGQIDFNEVCGVTANPSQWCLAIALYNGAEQCRKEGVIELDAEYGPPEAPEDLRAILCGGHFLVHARGQRALDIRLS